MSATLPKPSWRSRMRQLGLLSANLLQPQLSSAGRERRDVLLLLSAVALVILPHMEQLAWWANGALTTFWLWRLWLTLAQKQSPRSLMILPLLAAAIAAVWLQYGSLIGRDAGVTFLLMLLGLKLLELRAQRDVSVVVFLSLFILLTQFLFSQSLTIAALTLVSVLLLFVVLISVNQQDSDQAMSNKLRLAGMIFLKALPLTAAMFLLFPRLSGPLWSMPGVEASRTGLSNTMSPGTVGRLLESQEIALRARFTGALPSTKEMYWRGPVFGSFSGRTWSPLTQRISNAPGVQLRFDRSSAHRYEVTLEPHQRDWLFILEMPAGPPEAGSADLRPYFNNDAQLLSARLIHERVRYEIVSYASFNFGLNETESSLRDWLVLPSGYNPRALQFAAQLREKTTDAGNLVNAVLDHFRDAGFRYTLAPPVLGRNSVDEFLFETKLGFCEHYASAFVVLMRALDIPARVVTGYQGGEINPVDGYLTVRQSDAHAWAEVWLQGRGWVRVDPTAVVAPARNQRAEAAQQTAGATGTANVRAVSWLRALRFNWEAVENRWNQWVLSYSADTQRSLLKQLGLRADTATLASAFAICLTALLLVMGALSLRHRRERDPLAELTQAFRVRLLDAGISVIPSDGLRTMQTALTRHLSKQSQPAAQHILQALERWRYSRDSAAVPAAEVRKLKQAIRRFRAETA